MPKRIRRISYICECVECSGDDVSMNDDEFEEWVDPDHDNRDLILKDHLQYYEKGTYTILYERDDFMVIQVEDRDE